MRPGDSKIHNVFVDTQGAEPGTGSGKSSWLYKIHRPSGETVSAPAGLSVVAIDLIFPVAKLKKLMEEEAAPGGGIGMK